MTKTTTYCDNCCIEITSSVSPLVFCKDMGTGVLFTSQFQVFKCGMTESNPSDICFGCALKLLKEMVEFYNTAK